jgi:dTDP-4-dehydrorhamnose 3,5-epimerase
MKIIKTKFKDLLIFKSKNFYDKRGYFRELSLEKLIKQKLIFTVVSKSKKNVLRGLHFQKKNSQGKYLSVLKGEIFDVALDCRPRSKTFGKHFKILLSDKNSKSIFIPPGFAHGFIGIKNENIVMYGCTNYRDKESESGILWNDPSLKIKWPITKPLLSTKDKKNHLFKFFFNKK